MLPWLAFLDAEPVLLLLFAAIPLDTDELDVRTEVEDTRPMAVVLGWTVMTVVSASNGALELADEDANAPPPDADGAELVAASLNAESMPADVEPRETAPELEPDPDPDPELAVPSPPETIRPVPQGIAAPSGCDCCGAGTC